MGSVQSTFKTVDNHAGAIAAGLAVTLKSDDTITTTLSDGTLIGVSAGKSLSDTSRTAIIRRGSRVPILVDSLTPVIGAQVQVHATSGKAVTSGTAVNATIASGLLNAVLEDGSIVSSGCILIDMPGGL
jgi:hypothetical protein